MSDIATIPQQIEIPFPGDYSPTHWQPPEDLAFADWRDRLALAGRLGQSARFWLGDGLVFGERVYGEEHAAAIEVTHLEYRSIQNLMWVSRRVPPKIRREELSWSHHEAVAKLDDPQEMAKWLEKAVAHRWTRDELRAQFKEPKAPGEVAERSPIGEARQERMRLAFESCLGRWFGEIVKDREVEKLRKDKAFRVAEFERLSKLLIRRAVFVLGGKE